MEVVKFVEKDNKGEKIERKATPIDTLYHTINVLEVQLPGQPEQVIAQLKGMLMIEFGLIEAPTESEVDKNEKPEAKDVSSTE